ncbi:ProQ/FINO family protein [Rickettsia peacockii]|uniref:ProQ/FINO family protein n=1 Tax=Rickettsia peacockii TaxID=47589 RepID=UPI000304D009|nr:ProQ/FINO family protein [Rickettsia peacockii]
MNTITNTERPKLKLNFGAKPLTLATNANSLVLSPALKKIVVFEKPKESVKDVGSTSANTSQKDEVTGTTKTKSRDAKKSKKQETTASNKKEASSKKVVATPEEILKDKIKRRKKEYFSILTKLQADYPECFSEEPKPLAIGIDLELKKILNGALPNIQLGRFFHRYCGSFKYKEKLVEGAQRFNLDGSPATLVTKKEVPVIAHKPKFVKKDTNT